MYFTIVTPSFKQLDYLACCIASVADQGTGSGRRRTEDGGQEGSVTVRMSECANARKWESTEVRKSDGAEERISVEHIVQDAGSPGIEEFAEKTAERLLGQYGGERVTNLQTFELLHIRTSVGYTLRIFKEPDSGMYDAVNRGLKKGTGKICAYLNCDEQYFQGSLRRIAQIFADHQNWDLVFGGLAIVDPVGRLISIRRACRLSLPHVMTCHLPNFTAGMFFRRTFLSKSQAWFDSSLRDVADAVWVITRLKEEIAIGCVPDITSAFTDTGANMNLSPNARREVRILRQAAPRWMKFLKPWWTLRHRLNKFLDGAYWPRPFQYQMYMRGPIPKRTAFSKQRANPIWWSRLCLKDPNPSA